MTVAQNSALDTKQVAPQQADKLFLADLSRFQRLLLITDGTVTNLLEQYLNEAIIVKKLYEKVEYDIHQLPLAHEDFIHAEQMPVVKRKVLLEGQATNQHWIYAESSILLNNLPQHFRTELLLSEQPIGKLWEKYKTETYKVILHSERINANHLARYFDIEENDVLLSRTYGVYSNKKLTIVITESFPSSFFTDK
jgi:chorismate-pyruvate lyase